MDIFVGRLGADGTHPLRWMDQRKRSIPKTTGKHAHRKPPCNHQERFLAHAMKWLSGLCLPGKRVTRAGP